MKVTSNREVRVVENVRYVHVDNVAVLGFTPIMVGVGRIKVVKLAKGGYSVRALGKSSPGGIMYRNGGCILRVDSSCTSLAALFFQSFSPKDLKLSV